MEQLSLQLANTVISRAVNESYHRAYTSKDFWFRRVTKIHSGLRGVTKFPIFNNIGRFRKGRQEGLGTTPVKDGEISTYPDDFSKTLMFKKSDIEDNPDFLRSDMSFRYTGELFFSEIQFMIADVLRNGNTSTYKSWNGNNLFSAANANLAPVAVSLTQAGPTEAQLSALVASVDLAISNMRSIKDDEDRPMGIRRHGIAANPTIMAYLRRIYSERNMYNNIATQGGWDEHITSFHEIQELAGHNAIIVFGSTMQDDYAININLPNHMALSAQGGGAPSAAQMRSNGGMRIFASEDGYCYKFDITGRCDVFSGMYQLLYKIPVTLT